MKTTLTSLSFAMAMIYLGIGEEPTVQSPEAPPEMAAVAANDRAYEAAYAKADVKTLLDFYADDVVYTDEAGNIHKGRAAIEETLTAAFAANKGAKLSIELESVRVLTPDVLVETGSTTVVQPDGDASASQFTAIHVKKDGKWKISQLIETQTPAANPGDNLSELAWLVGEWNEADKDSGVSVHSRYQWARGGNFITRNVTVKRGDDPVLEGWQIIGWDPVEEGIRSWTFDGAGGYSEGRWTSEGQRWLVRETGYATDGSRTSADQTITKTGDDRFFWESGNRTLNGDPQPSIGRIEISRVKGE